MSLGQSNRGVKKENLYIFSSLSLLLMFTITTQTRAAGKKGLQRCKSTTKIISVTITSLNWACCFHLRERLSSYFTFSFLQYSREGSYGLEEFHDDSEQACALWCNRYTTCKEAIINFEKYSARQSNIFSALTIEFSFVAEVRSVTERIGEWGHVLQWSPSRLSSVPLCHIFSRNQLWWNNYQFTKFETLLKSTFSKGNKREFEVEKR